MADVRRIAAPRVVRLVAAAGPGPFDGEIRFHRRLTVLADARPGLAAWAMSLLSFFSSKGKAFVRSLARLARLRKSKAKLVSRWGWLPW